MKSICLCKGGKYMSAIIVLMIAASVAGAAAFEGYIS